MKKLFVYGLSIAMIAGAASCKKSSKGKMDNEWKVASMSQESSEVDSNGDKTSSTMTIEGDVVTITDTDANGDTDKQTGTVVMADWTISKDGTWSRTLEMNITSYTPAGGSAVTIDATSKMEDSGTWDFLGGVNGDFKKNERIVINTLSSKSTSSYTFSGTTSTDVSEATYAEGEMSEIMVITESKKKELMMSKDESSTDKYTPDGGTASSSSATSTMTVSLTQE